MAEVRDQFRAAIGARYVLTEEADCAAYEQDQRGVMRGRALCVLLPGSTEDVAALVRICAEHRIAIVPQAGNTGLNFGAVTSDARDQVILSVRRLNRIERIDPVADSITLGAGCILETAQQAAEDHSRMLAIDLGARGSCQLGGNLSTNAGGINVLAYGNSRDQVLGLEVVLADGSIWNGLKDLRKDNTGYDLKHWFIGAEGTLGIITRAVLKLHPLSVHRVVACSAVESPQAALKLMNRLRSGNARLTSIELMPDDLTQLTCRTYAESRFPLGAAAPWYVLSEHSFFSGTEADAQDSVTDLFAAAFEDGSVQDAVIARSTAEAVALWSIRENMPPAQKGFGYSVKHDVAVPVAAVPELIAQGMAAAQQIVPGCRPVPFGHLGDGNMHFNISQPEGMSADAFAAHGPALNRALHDIVVSLNGSISAEHGIGLYKKAELARLTDPVKMQLMRRMKQALDPQNTMNPGKIFDL